MGGRDLLPVVPGDRAGPVSGLDLFLLRRTIRRVPDAEVVAGLLLALLAAEAPVRNPVGLANHLQQLADTMRRALPGRFPGVHPDSERGLREEARSVAAAVQRMSMDVLLGGEGAQARVLAPRLGEMLVHVAEGEWASLERADPKAAGPARRLAPGLPVVVVAAAPLLVGLGLRFGVVWAILHALRALDPQATEKIGQTQGFLERLP